MSAKPPSRNRDGRALPRPRHSTGVFGGTGERVATMETSGMKPSRGSVATARRAMPKPADRATTLRCARRLRYAAEQAEIAATGEDWTEGAGYIVGAIEDLERVLARVRAVVASLGVAT